MKVFTSEDKKNPDLELHLPIVRKFTSDFMKKWPFDYDDVYSEIMYQVFLALRNYDESRGNVSTLLYSSKKNILIKTRERMMKLRNEHYLSKKPKLNIDRVDLENLPNTNIDVLVEEERKEWIRKNSTELLERLTKMNKRHHLVAWMRCNKIQFTPSRAKILFGTSPQAPCKLFRKHCSEI